MSSPVTKKLGMKPGMRAFILEAPPKYLKSLALLPVGLKISSTGDGAYDFVQIFATHLSEMRKIAAMLAKHAAANALVWIAYPKKTSGIDSDLSRDAIREAMIETGWDTVSIVAIDEVWSALRFRPAGQVGSRVKRGRHGG